MKKLITATLLATLVLSSCWKTPVTEEKIDIPTKSVKIEAVKLDYFTEDTKLIGKIATDKETIISSQTSGVIKAINTSVGKHVKAGEVLASIDFSTSPLGVSLDTANNAYSNAITSYSLTKESIEKDLQNAKLQLENARTSKENTYSSTDRQLQLSQTQLDNILTQKSNTVKTSGVSLELARKSRDSAKLNVDNFEKTSAETLKSLQDKKKGLYATIQSSVDGAIVSIDSALTQADLILGLTNKNRNANDAFATYLWAKGASSKTNAESAFWEAKKAYDALVVSKSFASSETTESALSDTTSVVDRMLFLYEKLVVLLDNSIVSSQFPQTMLDGLKAVIAGKQTGFLSQTQPGLVSLTNGLRDINNSISSAETTVETTRVSLNTALGIAEANLSNAQAGITSTLDSVAGNEALTRAQLENTISGVKSARDTVDNAIKIAEAQYESARAKLQTQLTGAKSQADASKGQKNIAGIQFENGLIKAPFEGIILTKQIEVGGLVNPGTPAFTIGDDSKLLVRLDVNSDIVWTLTLGQEVRITKGEKTLTGSVSLLSPGSDLQTKMFRMEAKISDNTAAKEIWNIGDYADVYLLRKRGDKKTITVPFSAIMSGLQGDFLIYTVAEGNIVKSRMVKVGAQNGSSVEILSGLSEGEKIVTEWVLNLQEGDKVEERK